MARMRVDTTAVPTGRSSAKTVTAYAGASPTRNTSQTGGNGNANINPYNNAYQTYATNLGKVRDAQIGQLNTEYNNQQKQIEGIYQNLGRNAYVTYMQRNLANRNRASNMGVTRDGMAENMATAGAVDYNRSIGNVGAYRQTQLSNAENAYNANVAAVNNQYNTDLANAQNQYAQMRIQRNNELADLRSQQAFQARENARDRRRTANDANRSLRATRYQNRFQVFADTISGYRTVKDVDKAIKNLQNLKKTGKLTGWRKEYYSDMMSYLRAQRNVVVQNKKKK